MISFVLLFKNILKIIHLQSTASSICSDVHYKQELRCMLWRLKEI
uniref:Uncharacterized protein n=1 Tax=Anguilla anguilla TaxID=7936 RepID=A0A0E9T909_ANGAN